MALEDRGAQHDKVVVDKYHNPVANYQMTTRDYVLRPSSVAGAITITLPRVAEAKGRWYSIISRGGPNVTIQDFQDANNNGDSECWQGNIVLNGICDRVLLYSDGLAWHPIGNVGAWPGFDTTAAPGTTTPPSTAAPTTAASQTTGAPSTAAATTAAPTTAAPTTGG